MGYAFVPLSTVERWLPLIRERDVAASARAPGGFIAAYRKAGLGVRLSDEWQRKREAFIRRTLAAAVAQSEPWWQPDGQPTRRHLSLLAWAYSPTPTHR